MLQGSVVQPNLLQKIIGYQLHNFLTSTENIKYITKIILEM